MAGVGNGGEPKPATAARIYDYHLGGIHNFPADRAAGDAVARLFPLVPALARTNRAFLRRAVRHLAESGVRQFLDIGSGIPTAGNVHEVARSVVPDARVVYVDIDPVAVSESLEILDGDERAGAVRADVRDPQAILGHPQVRRLLDFGEPVGLLLVAVLHFVPDDEAAQAAVRPLREALVPGSYVVVSHAASDGVRDDDSGHVAVAKDVYQRSTATPFHLRSRPQVERFFEGLEIVEPGVVWLPEWHPAPDDPTDFAQDPSRSAGLAGVARVR
ncbi:SAM-dependent methyltransferase [Dactylosporangium roseum]|uniref:SAM-dependent methyltransferase n=1 Tax=Dactylosporangium roseum TaxID=47989 RepID=A0ABY5YVV7_9ACTN|nr:SAM-dependent methyltransferase [Dactylosporangium roseum]UWZ33511.1 SAM-dependent methyltransferase [Dactylosporangium roseum]